MNTDTYEAKHIITYYVVGWILRCWNEKKVLSHTPIFGPSSVNEPAHIKFQFFIYAHRSVTLSQILPIPAIRFNESARPY